MIKVESREWSEKSKVAEASLVTQQEKYQPIKKRQERFLFSSNTNANDIVLDAYMRIEREQTLKCLEVTEAVSNIDKTSSADPFLNSR